MLSGILASDLLEAREWVSVRDESSVDQPHLGRAEAFRREAGHVGDQPTADADDTDEREVLRIGPQRHRLPPGLVARDDNGFLSG
mgnify:CR=1 FL=1